MTSRAKTDPGKTNYWSAEVTHKSDALDLETGVFAERDPKHIARSLKASAEHSKRRKAGPYQSAMSMLNLSPRALPSPRSVSAWVGYCIPCARDHRFAPRRSRGEPRQGPEGSDRVPAGAGPNWRPVTVMSNRNKDAGREALSRLPAPLIGE